MTTRLLKCECRNCGYVARITRAWLQLGTPTCVCGIRMSVKGRPSLKTATNPIASKQWKLRGLVA